VDLTVDTFCCLVAGWFLGEFFRKESKASYVADMVRCSRQDCGHLRYDGMLSGRRFTAWRNLLSPSSHRALEVQVAVSSKPLVTLYHTVVSRPIKLQSLYLLPWELQIFHHSHYVSQHVASLSQSLEVTARTFFLWDDIHLTQKLQMSRAIISVHHMLHSIQRDYFLAPLPMGWYFTNTRDVSKSQVPEVIKIKW